MLASQPAPLETRRRCHAQVQVCALGCCCGRTDRGKPPVPVDAIKAAWKARGLMKPVQLTFTGCLGPCDLVNVVALLTSDGRTTWLGGLTDPAHFDAIVAWAEAVTLAGRPVPLPALLAPFRFERWHATPIADVPLLPTATP